MKHFIFLFFVLFTTNSFSQITGKVTDEAGIPLPYASVFLQGTTNGTSTNNEGDYYLEVPEGIHKLTFQYIGYETKSMEITVKNRPLTVDISLKKAAFTLATIEVNANAEDPAYPIIRKTIKKREYYDKLIDKYSCKVYIKGFLKIMDAPEKLLGQEIGDMGGSLDSNRQGIIYLSESQSTLYSLQPNHKKEVMTSSIVSGTDNGMSFNSAMSMDFDLNKNRITFGRSLLSPIADNALAYYKYKLLGTLVDESGRLINKIEIIPKRPEDPVYRGIIYIVEDLWRIQSADIYLPQAATRFQGLDTLFIKQIHVPIEGEKWALLSQTVTPVANILGIKLTGKFTSVFSDYNLQPDFDKNFFDNEFFKVEKKANKTDSAFWATVRPIPLTEEETLDYHRKDSIKIVRKSKVYLDSVDNKNNKFKPIHLLAGYTHNWSYAKKSLYIASPIATFGFTPVHGGLLSTELAFNQYYDEDYIQRLKIYTKLSYGLSEEKFRPVLGFTYHDNNFNFTNIKIEGGIRTQQFDRRKPISLILNELYALYCKKNYLKIYEKTFVRGEYQREIVNGIWAKAHIEYARRKPLTIHSDYSLKRKDEHYPSNHPLDAGDYSPSFTPYSTLLAGFTLRFRIKQKYITYPKFKIITASAVPDLLIHYEKGIKLTENSPDFDKITLQIKKDDIRMGLLGTSEFNLLGHYFLNKKDVRFPDYFHFSGNQTIFGSPSKYLRSYMLLDYYKRSTTAPSFQLHYQHHFNGYILDKLPLLRKLGFSTVLRTAMLLQDNQKSYTELSVGIDNIGFKMFRMFRVDYVWSFEDWESKNRGWMIGITLPVGE